MIRNIHMLAAALLLVTAPFAAGAETQYTFDSITSIEQLNDKTSITGTLVNETTPTTLSIPAGQSNGQDLRCERLYLLVLSQPSAYRFTVVTDVIMAGGGPPSNLPPVPTTVFLRCKVDVKS